MLCSVHDATTGAVLLQSACCRGDSTNDSTTEHVNTGVCGSALDAALLLAADTAVVVVVKPTDAH